MGTRDGTSISASNGIVFELRYHVPRSQVWEGSRGAQSGKTHLHARRRFHVGRIRREAGEALCGRRGWYERTPDGEHEFDDLCRRCVEIASRDGASG